MICPDLFYLVDLIQWKYFIKRQVINYLGQYAKDDISEYQRNIQF